MLGISAIMAKLSAFGKKGRSKNSRAAGGAENFAPGVHPAHTTKEESVQAAEHIKADMESGSCGGVCGCGGHHTEVAGRVGEGCACGGGCGGH